MKSLLRNCMLFTLSLALSSYFPAALALFIVFGSTVKEYTSLPRWYMADSRNVFNVYFVKLAWGWTLGLNVLYILAKTTSSAHALRTTLNSLLRMVLGTAVWFLFTNAFIYVENSFGTCSLETVKLPAITSRAACEIVHNRVWNGFDISGHAFLLTYCMLVIRSELFASHDNASNYWLLVLNQALVIALLCLMCLWLWMLTWTLLYFHIWSHLIVGATFAFLAWGVTYGLWFGRTCAPVAPWDVQPEPTRIGVRPPYPTPRRSIRDKSMRKRKAN
uniref:acyl-coenzyme A diphosphatase FITM2-like n=1 Tax=Myxine glutinosa TaxID=7769 RepID=UPI00358F39C3